MIDADAARRIAQDWISANMQFPEGYEDETIINEQLTREEDFGWIFFYNSQRWIEDGKSTHRLAGNGPIIVKRSSGEILVTGTARPVERYVEELKSASML